MRKFLLGTSVLIVLAGPALAADMRTPLYKAPPPVAPAWSWTGCYVGGHAGGLRANSTEWVVRTPGNLFFGRSLGGHAATGWVGGGQAGCDYQFAGGFVIGIQGDYDWTNANGSHVDVFGNTHTHNTKSVASVTGRLGYAWDRFLLYVRGGGAWERDNYALTVPPGGFVAPIPGFTALASETRGGWVLGVGGEYAFTNFLSGFIEYDYYNFGTRTVNFTNPNTLALIGIDIRERKSVIKGGLNFRFGGGPVVARY